VEIVVEVEIVEEVETTDKIEVAVEVAGDVVVKILGITITVNQLHLNELRTRTFPLIFL
jgi:hypothetical protein